jgi:predicted phosphoribosyltransferase
MFADRVDAGRKLALALEGRGLEHALVLGIPRGGVIVALEVATLLGAPLDVVIPHKLGAPSNAELGVGAVAADGTRVLDERLVRALRVEPEYIEAETIRQRAEIERRLRTYRASASEPDVAGRTCVLVDDGMATGATAEVAAVSLRRRGARRVVLAVPVGPDEAVRRLRGAADDVVSLQTPEPFYAVGQWYERFEQVTDEEVLDALRAGHRSPGD